MVSDFFFFKGVKINVVNILTLINHFEKDSLANSAKYICVSDVGNVVNAYNWDNRLKNAINNSFLSIPDGRPLSIYGRLLGFKQIDRVSGADLMKCLFNEGFSHCFIGDTEELHVRLKDNIKNNYPKAVVNGGFSPPFRVWNDDDNDEIIRNINNFDADIVWISFGGGKQEVWMHDNCRKVKRGILIGIGAGFRWFLGDIKQAPPLLQKLSVEWLFRLVQQPKMFSRYASTLPFFVVDSLCEYLKFKVFKKDVFSSADSK